MQPLQRICRASALSCGLGEGDDGVDEVLDYRKRVRLHNMFGMLTLLELVLLLLQHLLLGLGPTATNRLARQSSKQ
jgi:hypothetical protein